MNFVDAARWNGIAGTVPIIGHFRPAISSDDRRKIAALAARIAAEDRHLSVVPPFKADVAAGVTPGVTLTLEDHSAIQLARENDSDRGLGYRALLLGQDGDFVALRGPRNLAFEGYCRDLLSLGRVEALSPRSSDPTAPLAIACAEDPRLVRRLVAAARASGGLTLLPYMATGGVWHLAGMIAETAGVPVRVAGPPPNLARAANDKLWFAGIATDLLGQNSVPPGYSAYGMASLIAHLQQLRGRYVSVVVKLSHSAASLGNLIFNSSELSGISALDLRNQLAARMAAKGWAEPFPVQVTAWEGPLIGSPSAQLWIPASTDGDPVVEGVFDQILSGVQARFSGAEPSRLPQRWQERIARDALRLGLLLQALGWYGRCSFDAVLVDGPRDADLIHWVECNGRWGGVSIPMTLANRLAGDWRRSALHIVCHRMVGGRPMAVADFLAKFAAELYRAGESDVGAALLSPGHLEAGTGIDLLIFGRNREDAFMRSDSIVGRLAT